MIFEPDKKTGEVMGREGWRRWGKDQRRAFAIQKQAEEERRNSGSFYKTQRACEKFRETVRRQRREAGLDGI
jgi:hypothetical protein